MGNHKVKDKKSVFKTGRSKMPQDNADTDGDIERMLGAILRYFKGEIGRIHDILPDTIHLIPENECIFNPRDRLEPVKLDGTHCLLDADDGIAGLLQAGNRIKRVFRVFPFNAEFRPEGGLVDFSGRRHGTYPAKPYLIHPEGICTAESRADIVGAADIVQHDDNAGFRELPVLLRRNPA